MVIDYGEHYFKSEKRIKKKYENVRILDMVKTHIKQCSSFSELEANPISRVYGFEKLKYELNDYYSFNLCKNRGTIRLIVSIDDAINQVRLEYVSIDHYDDFKRIMLGK